MQSKSTGLQVAAMLWLNGLCMLMQIPLDTSKDMYVNQFEGFLKAVRTGDENHIRCSYATAALTYQASQWITIAANKNRNVGPWSRSGQDAGTISP